MSGLRKWRPRQKKQIEAGLMQTRSHHTGIDGIPKQKDIITCIKV